MRKIHEEKGKIYAILGDVYQEYVKGNLTEEAYKKVLAKYEKKLKEYKKEGKKSLLSPPSFLRSLQFMMAFRSLKRRKARTVLSTLGIVIGVTLIVTLASIGQGMQTQMTTWIKTSIGADLIVVHAGSDVFMPENKIPEEYVDKVARIDGVKSAIPELFETGLVNGEKCILLGVVPDMKITIIEGRSLNEAGGFEAVIGSRLKDKIGAEVGDSITIASINESKKFKVVGIFQTRAYVMDEACVTSLGTLQKMFDDEGKISTILVNVESPEKVDRVKEGIENRLQGITVIEQREVLEATVEGTTIINIFLMAIAAVSLLVAGLGIMNTMIISVMERRREIGIMKAIGTSKKRILGIFMIESTLHGTVGGVGGCLLGFVISKLFEHLSSVYLDNAFAIIVSPDTVIFGLLFALFISVVSGLYPSWRAATLKPVEALRSE